MRPLRAHNGGTEWGYPRVKVSILSHTQRHILNVVTIFKHSPCIIPANLASDNSAHSGETLGQNDDNESLYLHDLKNVVYELLRSVCVCLVCVKIANEELFCNAFPFENSYYYISGLA